MAAWLAHRPEQRIVVIGNAGGGKSTLARLIGASRGLVYVEVDRLLWREGWQLADPEAYLAEGGTASGGFAETHAFDKYEFRPIGNTCKCV